MTQLIIQDIPLKDVFRIFNRNEALHIIELGDTWHPSCGFVDETHFENIKTVEDL